MFPAARASGVHGLLADTGACVATLDGPVATGAALVVPITVVAGDLHVLVVALYSRFSGH